MKFTVSNSGVSERGDGAYPSGVPHLYAVAQGRPIWPVGDRIFDLDALRSETNAGTAVPPLRP
jgi:hypothetical protein